MKLTKKDKEFGKRLNCKLWDKCKDKECLQEARIMGSCIWSKNICYTLKKLENKGLIKQEIKEK